MVKSSSPEDSGSQSLDSLERRFIFDLAHRIIPAIGRSLPVTTEIVLHDLNLLPNSIVAVWGKVTNRQVGDPATDLLLEHIMRGAHHDLLGYLTYLPDGRQLHSSTIILTNSVGAPIGAFCVNSDVSPWITLLKVAEQMSGGASTVEPFLRSAGRETSAASSDLYPLGKVGIPQCSTEVFPTNVNQLASHLIESAIHESGVAVESMRKDQKVEVVRMLRSRGIFLLRDAAEIVGTAIGVSRFTVYNYIKELDGANRTVKDDDRPADAEEE